MCRPHDVSFGEHVFPKGYAADSVRRRTRASGTQKRASSAWATLREERLCVGITGPFGRNASTSAARAPFGKEGR